MASKSLIFQLLGKDVSASSAIKGVGKSASGLTGTFLKLGGIIAAAFTVSSIVSWGEEAVKAFATSQTEQNKLSDALARFPAIQGANLKALQGWNLELQKGSRFDHDAIAAGEAQLLQYGLNEAQLRKITPLLLDYAARTGKDLPSAAEVLGKALLGQGRALKDIGINFEDTGTVAGNFDELIGGLSTQVAGFATTDLATADGQLQNLKNSFGDVQVKIGEALMPSLSTLVDILNKDVLPAATGFSSWFTDIGGPAIQGGVEWIGKYYDILGPASAAVGALTAAQWLLNIAMDANPIGAVVIALGLLVGGIAALMTNVGGVQTTLDGVAFSLQGTFTNIMLGLQGLVEGFVNMVVDGINTITGPFGIPKIGHVDFTSGLLAAQRANMMEAAAVAKFGPDAKMFYVQAGPVSWGPTGTTPLSAPATTPRSLFPGGIPAYAEGGFVAHRPGGLLANIGEGRYDEAVVPLSPQILGQLGGGGGVTVEIHGNGTRLEDIINVLIRTADGQSQAVLVGGKVAGR